LITSIDAPAWSSTAGNICEYAYTFQSLPNGTYAIEESFTQIGGKLNGYPWNVYNTELPDWTYLGSTDEDLNQVHRVENLVVSNGADVTGIDLLLVNTD